MKNRIQSNQSRRTPMTAQETSVHSTSKHRWLIVFGLSVGLVPNSQPHTFSSVSPYGILKRCCRNCKIGVQSDAISSNHFPTAIHCNWCFLSPTIVSLPFLSPSFSPLLPFPIRLTLLHLHPTILFSQTHIQHWYTDLSRVMSAKTLADNTCLKCRKPVSHPCLSLLWTLCLGSVPPSAPPHHLIQLKCEPFPELSGHNSAGNTEVTS